jgi:hypothetical protein
LSCPSLFFLFAKLTSLIVLPVPFAGCPSRCVAHALRTSSLARHVAVLVRASLSLCCVCPSHVVPLSSCHHSHSHAPLIALSAPFVCCPSLVMLLFSFVCRSRCVSSILMTFSFACRSHRIVCALHTSSILMTFSFALSSCCVHPSRIIPLSSCHRSHSRVPLIVLPAPFTPRPSLGRVAIRVHASPLIVLPVPFACHPSLIMLPFSFARPLIVLSSHVIPLSSCHHSPSSFALIALPFM